MLPESNLAFFHADIAWRSKNWRSGIAPLKAGVLSPGIRFGIIIGGNPDYTDNISWTQAGLDQLKALAVNAATAPEDVIIQSWQPLPTQYRTVTGDPSTRPDNSVFQTWHSYPTRFLPENRPGTLTSVVVQTMGAR